MSLTLIIMLILLKKDMFFFSDSGLEINYANNTYLIDKGSGFKMLYA
jgi:hypothetical protein